MKQEDKSTDVSSQDGLDVVGTLAFLLGYRSWIIGCVLFAGIAGVVYALLAPQAFTAGAILSLKDREMGDGTTRLLSQFGAFGGGGANNSLEKLAIILKSPQLAEQVVRDNDLLPELLYKKWDAANKRWKPKYAKQPPTNLDGARLLRGKLDVDVNIRKGIINISVKSRGAQLSRNLVEMYLKALSERIRSNVMATASIERRYLEAQLGNTLDPVLQEKIQNMIVFQVERSMLVSAQSFEVLEAPMVPRLRSEPQRKKIVLVSLFAGFFFSIGGIYALAGFRQLRKSLRARKAAGSHMEHR